MKYLNICSQFLFFSEECLLQLRISSYFAHLKKFLNVFYLWGGQWGRALIPWFTPQCSQRVVGPGQVKMENWQLSPDLAHEQQGPNFISATAVVCISRKLKLGVMWETHKKFLAPAFVLPRPSCCSHLGIKKPSGVCVYVCVYGCVHVCCVPFSLSL